MLLALVLAGCHLAFLVSSSGEGNIHLLEEEIETALKICSASSASEKAANSRPKRDGGRYDDSYKSAKIDSNGNDAEKEGDYVHARRDTGRETQLNALNDTGMYEGEVAAAGSKGGDPQLVNTVPEPARRRRVKRLDPLTSKISSDECLSQCVFANMQVVDDRGIPRQAELWAVVQAAVTSQQSRAALRDQLNACFQELESEAEDDGCSYSNKLERCLTLHLADRRAAGSRKT